VHEIVDECLFRAAAGEQADVGFGLGAMAAGHAAIVRMMRDKTAAYSFAAPLRAGATLARASEAVREELGRIGMRLGVLYQLRDDVLGVFGERDLTGKSVTGDLREGKRTLLVALAEPHPAWQEVRHLFGRRSLDPSDAERLRGALVDSGALRWIEGIILGLRERVDRRIARSSLPSGLRRELSALASSCAERDA
jgi:geranylgeranyl diphosphate synthase type II